MPWEMVKLCEFETKFKAQYLDWHTFHQFWIQAFPDDSLWWFEQMYTHVQEKYQNCSSTTFKNFDIINSKSWVAKEWRSQNTSSSQECSDSKISADGYP